MSQVKVEFQVLGVKNVQDAFRTVEQAAVRAESASVKGAQRTGRARASEADKAAKAEAKAAEKAAKERIRADNRALKDLQRQQDKATRERERAYMQGLKREEAANARHYREAERLAEASSKREIRAKESALRHVARVKERYFVEEQRRNEQVARAEARVRERFRNAVGSRSSMAASRGLSSAARTATGLAGAALSIGGGFSISESLQKNIANRGTAADIANSGYMPGKGGAAGIKQDSGKIASEASNVGVAYGIDQAEVLEGLGKFTSKTGDLQKGREIMMMIGQTARATGSSFEDLADMAGDIFNADTSQSADELGRRMRFISAQGKEGAVEVKNLASQMAKLGAAATQYSGDKGDNMAQLGAIAQLARKQGGAATASNAATSVLSFSNLLNKGNTVSNFKSFGVETRDSAGNKRQPIDIIMDAMKAAEKKGGMKDFDVNMSKMVSESSARKSTAGLEAVYKAAGGGKAGEEAALKAFNEIRKASMSEAQEKEAAARRVEETDAKIAKSMQELHRAVGEKLVPELNKILPTIVKLIPHFEKFLVHFGNVIAWAAENPMKAAFAGLGAAVTKSLLAELASAGIGAAISRVVGGGAGGGGGAAGALGSPAGLVGAAGAAAVGGTAMIMAQNEEGYLGGQMQAGALGAQLSGGNASQKQAAVARIQDAKRGSAMSGMRNALTASLAMSPVGVLGVAADAGMGMMNGRYKKQGEDEAIAKFARTTDQATAALEKLGAAANNVNPAAANRNQPMSQRGGTQ